LTHVIGDWSLKLISQERVTADLKYKEKERKGRFGEIDEKITREQYTLDWSQSKVFLKVLLKSYCLSLYGCELWDLSCRY